MPLAYKDEEKEDVDELIDDDVLEYVLESDAEEDGDGDQLELGGVLEGDDGAGPLSLPLLPPLFPPDSSKISKFALTPLGTVTTQKAAPPAPSAWPPTIWFTEFCLGSILHGRPLQPGPSQVISTPQVGISLRKGVAGSR